MMVSTPITQVVEYVGIFSLSLMMGFFLQRWWPPNPLRASSWILLTLLKNLQILGSACSNMRWQGNSMGVENDPILYISWRNERIVLQCLFWSFPQDIYMTLLTISFTSLSWKDTSICQRSASVVCWSLLRQVCHSFWITLGYLHCSLLPPAVTIIQ